MIKTPNFSKRVALLGGSFNPPHLGHLQVAQYCLDHGPSLDTVYFLPCYKNPHKQDPIASPQERLHFLHLALQDTPFSIWSIEIQEKKSFTVDTLRLCHQMKATRDRLFWIVGADEDMTLWKEWKIIEELCQILTVRRKTKQNIEQNQAPKHGGEIIHMPANPLSSTQVREELSQKRIPQNALPPALSQHFALHGTAPYGR